MTTSLSLSISIFCSIHTFLKGLNSGSRNRDGDQPVRLGFADVNVSRGDHIGHFYRTRDERASLAVPYPKTGLEAGENCVYLVGSA
jgi:hypothetical protein